MINRFEVIETNKMIDNYNLDVRTITLGISLMDCISSDLDILNNNIYNKIKRLAKDLVQTGEDISKEYGIPIVNKRISVTPIALIGGAAGFFGGKVDSFLMRIVDILMAVPSSLLAMAIITAMGNGVWKLVVALAISQVARFARIVRSSVLTLRNVEFVEAAKCYGCSSLRIILKHILPNGIGPIIVSATLCLGQTILSISSMGYLGLGVASPTPEWGTIISENKINIQAYPYLGLIPGICICLTVMAVNFIGDGLRDAFDPRTKK